MISLVFDYSSTRMCYYSIMRMFYYSNTLLIYARLFYQPFIRWFDFSIITFDLRFSIIFSYSPIIRLVDYSTIRLFYYSISRLLEYPNKLFLVFADSSIRIIFSMFGYYSNRFFDHSTFLL